MLDTAERSARSTSRRNTWNAVTHSLRRLQVHMHTYPSLWAGLLILFIFGIVILFAPYIATHDPVKQNLLRRLKPPDGQNWFGTDELGRDIFSRVVFGAQISLPASLFVVVVSTIIGGALGAMAGFFRGAVD